MKTPERRLGTGIFRWLDPVKKGGWKESEKGPAPGWGWPSLGGLPTPAPLQEPEGYRQCRPGRGAIQCFRLSALALVLYPKMPGQLLVFRDLREWTRQGQATLWNFCCAATRPSESSSSTASAPSDIRNGRSFDSVVPKSFRTQSAVSIRPGGRPTPTLTRR